VLLPRGEHPHPPAPTRTAVRRRGLPCVRRAAGDALLGLRERPLSRAPSARGRAGGPVGRPEPHRAAPGDAGLASGARQRRWWDRRTRAAAIPAIRRLGDGNRLAAALPCPALPCPALPCTGRDQRTARRPSCESTTAPFSRRAPLPSSLSVQQWERS